MESKDWVLADKQDDASFIELTWNKVGNSKGLGRPGWQWTTDFYRAAGFRGYASIADAVKKHKIPVNSVKLRPYENAFSTWTQAQAAKVAL